MSNQNNDLNLVLVAEGKYFDISLKENLLKNNEIPCLIQSEYGSGFVMQAGNLLENYKLYVAKENLNRALELLDSELD
ncbi:MAG: hypothetical protein GX145_05630 [Clostridiaceae bacterium]|jgi:peptide subunit release factor 1 (eRF1)|nr:DUF2007 domain-containing protein [Bacillota bacterium]NLN52268.1 hypothetical protein [Clostridiaceae bacterium]